MTYTLQINGVGTVREEHATTPQVGDYISVHGTLVRVTDRALAAFCEPEIFCIRVTNPDALRAEWAAWSQPKTAEPEPEQKTFEVND